MTASGMESEWYKTEVGDPAPHEQGIKVMLDGDCEDALVGMIPDPGPELQGDVWDWICDGGHRDESRGSARAIQPLFNLISGC